MTPLDVEKDKFRFASIPFSKRRKSDEDPKGRTMRENWQLIRCSTTNLFLRQGEKKLNKEKNGAQRFSKPIKGKRDSTPLGRRQRGVEREKGEEEV
jgi:hypothetical protein